MSLRRQSVTSLLFETGQDLMGDLMDPGTTIEMEGMVEMIVATNMGIGISRDRGIDEWNRYLRGNFDFGVVSEAFGRDFPWEGEDWSFCRYHNSMYHGNSSLHE